MFPLTPLYTYSELDRLRHENLTQEELNKILEFLDPELLYDNILQLEPKFWTLKHQEEDSDEVILDIRKLKKVETFIKNPTNWLYNFYFQWKIKYNRLCVVTLQDRESTRDSLQEISLKDIGRYVSLKGRVKRISGIAVAITSSIYRCKNCLNYTLVDRIWYDKLQNRSNCRCGSKEIIEIEEKRRFEVWQTIALQSELIDSTNTSLILDCRILNKLDFNKVVPGESIKIRGILKTEATEKAKTKLYLDVYGLDKLEKSKTKITSKKIEFFKSLSHKESLISELIKRIFPHISGLDQLKQAALLQYLGAGNSTQRTTIHLLVAGDPGVGKSQLLKSLQKNLDGIYVTGLGSTVPGLTASVYKDNENQWNLDGGAVVLANSSTLLIDEADKLSTLVCNSLLEPMEQQTVSISKAGLCVNLPAKTNIFAVSNPKFTQKFKKDSKLTYRQQLGFTPPFLSRFDLIFLITQESQDFLQKEIINSVLDLSLKETSGLWHLDYLRYAKSLNPTLSKELKKELGQVYSDLKSKYAGFIALGPRALEALIRLCEAKAKLNLKTEVLREDLVYVKELYEASLKSQLEGTIMERTILSKDIFELRMSKKQESLMKKILNLLEPGPLKSEKLILTLMEKEPQVTNKELQKVITLMQKEGLIYNPSEEQVDLIRSK